MKTITSQHIEKAVQDIAEIKKVLADSKSSIQLLFLPVHFRQVFLLFGLGIFAFSGIYYFLVSSYGSFSSIPGYYRVIWLSSMLILAAVLGFLKNVNWIRSLSKIDPHYNFRKAYLEFFKVKIIHSYSIIGIPMLLFIIYWILTGQPYYIITTVCIGIGLIGNFTGIMTDLVEYTIMGCWTLIWGFIILFTGTIPGPVAIAASVGAGILIFALYSYARKDNQGV